MSLLLGQNKSRGTITLNDSRATPEHRASLPVPSLCWCWAGSHPLRHSPLLMVQGAELLHAARTLIPPVPPNAGYGGAACPLPAPGGTGWQGRAQALIKAGEEWQRLFPARFPPVLVRLPRAVLGSCSAELTKAMMHGKPTAVPAASFAAQGGLVCLPTVFLACGLRNLFSNVNTIWNIVYLKYIRDMRNNLSCCFFFFQRVHPDWRRESFRKV